MAIIHHFFPLYEYAFCSLLIMFFTVFGVAVSGRVAILERNSDPSKVVIDEVVGQMLCLLWVPVSAGSLLIGFLLFRIFDIVKPFPARTSERLPAGFGIMCDDLIAGIYAGASLKLIYVVLA